MKARDLVDKIAEKCDPEEELECIIIKNTDDAPVVVIDLKDKAKDIKKLMEMF